MTKPKSKKSKPREWWVTIHRGFASDTPWLLIHPSAKVAKSWVNEPSEAFKVREVKR